MINRERASGSSVNELDWYLNDQVCMLVRKYCENDGGENLCSFPKAIQWYIRMRRDRGEQLPPQETTTGVNAADRLRLTWRIIQDQTPQAVEEIRSLFATIKPLTFEDQAVRASLLAYKIFYSPPNQAGRMLDDRKCQRECSIGFAQWYVHARTSLGFRPNQALKFACTALMAKCEGLDISGTQIKSIRLWS